jgi:hypothetical protein
MLGHAAAVAAFALFSPLFAKSPLQFRDMNLAAILFLAAIGCVDGAAVGIAQSVVIKQYAQRDWARGWVVATALGGAIAWPAGVGLTLAGLVICGLNSLVVGGSLAGAAVGLMQDRVLKRHIPKRTFWTFVNGLAGILATLAGLLAGLAVNAGSQHDSTVTLGAAVLVGAAFYGSTTALLFVRLARTHAAPPLATDLEVPAPSTR